MQKIISFVHLEHKVTRIIPFSKQVLVENRKRKNAFLAEYDKLIIATGARPFCLKLKNRALNNVFTIRTIEDAIAIRNKLESSSHAVIIGGGYIGLEMLEAFVRQGVNTTLLERNPYIMSLFDNEMSELIKISFYL